MSFNLSDSARIELLDYYKDLWDNHFEHRLEYMPSDWLKSFAGTEVTKFLLKLKLHPYYTGINVFLSNTQNARYTNPHVDVLHKDKLYPIRSRFNIQCKGNNATMYWWDSIKWGSDKLVKNTFRSYSGIAYESYAVPGENADDRFKFLGTPSLSADNVLNPSAFVNTEYVHALYIPAGPRLVLSVGFDKELDKIKCQILN